MNWKPVDFGRLGNGLTVRVRTMIDDMRARIADIPVAQGPTWGAVVAVLRFDNRKDWKMHWTSEHPSSGDPFSVIDIEVPGEDVDALRAEVEEAVDLVNDIVARDPMKTMVRADVGLAEFYVR